MKGMLTGPVTILAWYSSATTSRSARPPPVAWPCATRSPTSKPPQRSFRWRAALRELLPLRKADQASYLDWSVSSFRLSTAGAADAAQIHTHLCYSEFGPFFDAIDGLDATSTSIEAARSRMEIIRDLESHGFGRGVGPGVYDIHSPRVPGEQEITELLRTAVKHVDPRQLWVDPDCGLKTRGYMETEESLRNLVKASRTVHAGLLEAAK